MQSTVLHGSHDPQGKSPLNQRDPENLAPHRMGNAPTSNRGQKYTKNTENRHLGVLFHVFLPYSEGCCVFLSCKGPSLPKEIQKGTRSHPPSDALTKTRSYLPVNRKHSDPANKKRNLQEMEGCQVFLGNIQETPTRTTSLKSAAARLQVVRQYAPHLYRCAFLASKS